MKVSVYFNKQRRNNSGFPIYLCIFRAPHRFYISTGLYSSVTFDGGVFPRTESNHRAKTIRLNEMIDIAEETMIKNSLAPLDLLKQKIRNSLFGCYSEKYLYEYINDFKETKTGRGTRENYHYTAKAVREFDSRATLDIDELWLERFERHRRKTTKQNSTAIHLRNIRAVFNWARKNRYTNNYPFDRFTIKHEKTRKRNVSINSLAEIATKQNLNYLERYRDLFMLMFYLIGINLTDLLEAKKNQLIDGRLEYERAKTHKWYSVKVEPEAMTIINKYKGKDYLLNIRDKASVHSFTSKIDQNLKDIYPGLSTYYARHSWATIAYSLGISKDVISQALGHSNGASVTEIYIERDPILVDDANRKVIDALNAKIEELYVTPDTLQSQG
ncbi:MAG: phage integrase SAM-like domain-containing protein [Prevotella sp.]|nr:phage integrase SAM-like domain-containing protein [Candidatus Prevotella equi]